MVRKIVMFRGGVETLDFFGKQMGMEFERQGISVFYFNLEDAKNEAKKVGKFIRSGETVMLTFNFEALEREEYIYQEQRDISGRAMICRFTISLWIIPITITTD